MTVDPVSLVPGQSIPQTLSAVWQSHINAHLDRCGSVPGPLAEWVCRQGHPLWGDQHAQTTK
jgi:hypothetical protein